MITNSKKLDGLIMANVSDVILPSEMSEFVEKVKEKIGDRFMKNFNPAVNESLFGWFTGVAGGAGQSIIYRAKGDVMNEYKKQIQTQGGDVAGVYIVDKSVIQVDAKGNTKQIL